MIENWKDVVGYEGLYQVSDQGNVRSTKRKGTPGKLKKFGYNANRYFTVGLSKQSCKKTVCVHRLVMETFVGALPEGMETRHLDGDKYNNCLSNLCYGTRAENVSDKVKHGTEKLTNQDVKDIRWLASFDFHYKDIAKFFGLSNSYAYNLANGFARTNI